jgi:hypothetical protein
MREMAKNMSCRKNIVYVDPDCCNETTEDAESTMTIPSADRAATELITR